MKIEKVSPPSSSLFMTGKREYDYLDAYSESFEMSGTEPTISDVAKAFFSASPKWIDFLFQIRNNLVKLLGLKTGGSLPDRNLLIKNFKGLPGESMGLFKVFERGEHELILGEDDKHLDFRVSLFLQMHEPEQYSLTISTLVKFHNIFGRIYFFPVKPFHHAIVQAMLKQTVQQLKQRSK